MQNLKLQYFECNDHTVRSRDMTKARIKKVTFYCEYDVM